jgi:phosphatidylserine synthase
VKHVVSVTSDLIDLFSVLQFGAELDSLNDFVCFGVAPAIVLYEYPTSIFSVMEI